MTRVAWRLAVCVAAFAAKAQGAAPCETPSAEELCDDARTQCGDLTVKDRCQAARQVTCGTCQAPQTCGAERGMKLCRVAPAAPAFFGPALCETGQWCSRRPTAPALGGDFGAVWAASATEAWAAPAAAGEQLQHLTDGAWTREGLPVPVKVRGFWGCGPSQVWAAGEGGELIAWNGKQWALRKDSAKTPLSSLWGTGCDDAWAVGGASSGSSACAGDEAPCPASQAAVLRRWNGKKWASVALPAAAEGIAALSGLGARTFALTSKGPLEFEAGRWKPLGDPGLRAPAMSEGLLWTSAASEVWAGGARELWLYNGATWVDQRHSDWYRSRLPDDFRLGGAWGARAGQLWVAGERQGQSSLFEWRDGAWTDALAPDVGPLRAVHAAAADAVWAAGSRGLLSNDGEGWRARTADTGALFEPPGTGEVWAALGQETFRWTGRWRRGPLFRGPVRALWGTGAKDAWAVVEEQARYHYSGEEWDSSGRFDLHHWDGERWRPVEDEVAARIRATAVWGSAKDDVWVVGYNPQKLGMDAHDLDSLVGAAEARGAAGTVSVIHLTPAGWQELKSPSAEHWLGVWGAAANDVWVVGTKGAILHWDGRALTAVKSPATRALLAVRGTSAQNVWAVGEEWVHWDGKAWTRVDAPARGVWSGLCGDGRELWAVGGQPPQVPLSEATLLHWRDGAWAREPEPAGIASLTSCLVSTAGDVWLGGEDGAVVAKKGGAARNTR